MDVAPDHGLTAATFAATQSIAVAVIMQRVPLKSAWQAYAWRPLDVMIDAGSFGAEARCLVPDPERLQWLFPHLDVALHRDEAESYYLNATSAEPVAFVHWRLEERDALEVAVPQSVTLSYGEAARWMDSGEQVEPLPLAPALRAWLDAYVTAFYEPEVRQRRRPQSFVKPEKRDHAAVDMPVDKS